MKLLFGQFKLIEKALLGFRNELPLNFYLKDFFKAHPQCGSRDRKLISRLIYNYFRTVTSFKGTDLLKQLIFSTYLTENILLENNILSNELPLSFDLNERIKQLQNFKPEFTLQNIFPFQNLLSDQINNDEFLKSILIRPIVWIRVRTEFANSVEKEMQQAGIPFIKNSEYPNAWSFDIETNLMQLESYKKGYFEIQDISSQRTADYFEAKESELWWDCCSGAGGKSLLLNDFQPTIKLFATDIRNSILQNLELRFNKAGFKNYKTATLDLTKNDVKFPSEFENGFDGIIADVPCTGSGTWARTPEQISFFNTDILKEFSEKQFAITTNAAKHLKKGGKLIYITCSVFKTENEDVVNRIIQKSQLQLIKSDYLAGFNLKSDTLFVAQFIK